MRFSNRSAIASRTNAWARLLEKKRAEGAPILDLTESNPTHCGFSSVPKLSALDERVRSYDPDPRGLLAAREAVADYYASKGITVHPDDIFMTCSTSEAYSFLFHLLCEAGDEVLSPSPGYPLFEHLARYNGASFRSFAGPFREEALGTRSKALVLVNPNNPTGRYIPEKEWEAVERIAEKRGVGLISDEVFFEFEWSATKASADRQNKMRTSGASRGGSLHFTLNGVSKMMGLPQMKLAWIVISGPAEQRKEAGARLEMIADTFLSANAVSQHALGYWLSQRDAFVSEVMGRLRANFAALKKILPSVQEPEGGWYAVCDLPAGVSDEAFALEVLEKRNVLVHPGFFFDLDRECVVVSLLPQEAVFQEAVRWLS